MKRNVATIACATGVCAMVLAGAPGLAPAFSPAAVTPIAYAAVDEQEPNNSFETATPIQLNTAVYGETDDESSDYYRFVLPANGTVKITIKNDKYVANGVWWGTMRWWLFDGDLEDTGATGYTSTNTLKASTTKVALTRGAHYLEVRCRGYDNPYRIKVAYSIPRTSLTSLKAGKRAFSAKWVKKSGAAYYQVRYTPVSTHKLYGWDKAKTERVSKNRSSLKAKGLKGKKKYYAQVRVAKQIAGVTYYSGWSGKRSVTTR